MLIGTQGQSIPNSSEAEMSIDPGPLGMVRWPWGPGDRGRRKVGWRGGGGGRTRPHGASRTWKGTHVLLLWSSGNNVGRGELCSFLWAMSCESQQATCEGFVAGPLGVWHRNWWQEDGCGTQEGSQDFGASRWSPRSYCWSPRGNCQVGGVDPQNWEEEQVVARWAEPPPHCGREAGRPRRSLTCDL